MEACIIKFHPDRPDRWLQISQPKYHIWVKQNTVSCIDSSYYKYTLWVKICNCKHGNNYGILHTNNYKQTILHNPPSKSICVIFSRRLYTEPQYSHSPLGIRNTAKPNLFWNNYGISFHLLCPRINQQQMFI